MKIQEIFEEDKLVNINFNEIKAGDSTISLSVGDDEFSLGDLEGNTDDEKRKNAYKLVDKRVKEIERESSRVITPIKKERVKKDGDIKKYK